MLFENESTEFKREYSFKYEEISSLNQELTFIEAEKEFNKRKVSFGINEKKTLRLMNEDNIYTNLGMLLSDQCIHTIKLAVFEGTSKAQFQDRREFTGSLFKQLNEVYEYIDRYNRTRSEIEGLYRNDKRDYPTEAVREALLNSLVHRDYSFSDSTLISIFDDRIEFVSIGGLVRGISFDDIMLGISVARNKNLANVFYRLTLIEAYGTGMPRIMRSYNGFDASPKIETSSNAFKITLPNVNEISKSNFLYEKEAIYRTDFLTESESIVLNLFRNKGYITRKEVEVNLNVSQAKAVRILKGLVEKGKIRIVDQGKNTKYTK
ncbi:MAG: hypothetical protein FWC47_08485 [Oscillospiraceae bacterium]|nr:hypothetical protein [Oscillospiraceae bacterium]